MDKFSIVLISNAGQNRFPFSSLAIIKFSNTPLNTSVEEGFNGEIKVEYNPQPSSRSNCCINTVRGTTSNSPDNPPFSNVSVFGYP